MMQNGRISTFLVEFSFMNFVGFRALKDATCLILVIGVLPPIKVGQERFGLWSDYGHDFMGGRCHSIPEPSMISELCSASDGMISSGLVLPLSSCHTMDGFKSLSTKVLGGTGSRLAPIRARMSAA